MEKLALGRIGEVHKISAWAALACRVMGDNKALASEALMVV